MKTIHNTEHLKMDKEAIIRGLQDPDPSIHQVAAEAAILIPDLDVLAALEDYCERHRYYFISDF